MHEIAARKGPLTLFAAVMRADKPGRWDLVVSAPWLGAGKVQALSELVELLSNEIGDKSLQSFARVATVRSDDDSVKFATENLDVDDGELHVKGTDLSRLDIESAVIFRAKA
jgi:hypothetical protein